MLTTKNLIEDLSNSGDLFTSVMGTAAEVVFIYPLSHIQENERGDTLHWIYAIFDLDDRMLNTESGLVGTIGALPHCIAKEVAEQVASQEAIRWITNNLPDAAIEVLQKGGNDE